MKRDDWNVDPELVVVVASCLDSREQVRMLGVYQCRNNRSMRPARYLALYAGGVIDTVAEIDGAPEDDVVVSRTRGLSALAKAMPASGDDPDSPRTVLKLKNVRDVGPIVNDKIGKNGKKTAWTQNQGYTTIGRLRKAKRTTEL